MEDGWRDRLTKALEEAGLSKRRASLAAGLGPGYLHSILSEGKDPTLENLLKVCAVVKASSSWVIFGYDLASPEVEELVQLWQAANAETRDGIRRILLAHKTP